MGPGGWSADIAPVDRSTARDLAYWSDRAWWSLNPDATSRSRPLLDGEFEELLERAELLTTENADRILSAGATGVTVSRYDMFLEEGLHLRGMIRERELPQLDMWSPMPRTPSTPTSMPDPQKAQRPEQ